MIRQASLSLTKSQQKVFDYIAAFIDDNGFSPSYGDISQRFNFSSDGTVRTYLEHLENKGYIKRNGKARSIIIIKNQKKTIPILGQISAGPTKDAIEDKIGSVDEISLLYKTKNRFALKINGDSMINAGIHNNDIAIIEKHCSIKQNDIVAIMIENEATLKRIQFDNNFVILIPENDNYEKTTLSKEHFDIQLIGKFVGLIREL